MCLSLLCVIHIFNQVPLNMLGHQDVTDLFRSKYTQLPPYLLFDRSIPVSLILIDFECQIHATYLNIYDTVQLYGENKPGYHCLDCCTCSLFKLNKYLKQMFSHLLLLEIN